MSFLERLYLNRTICDVLEEMRKCSKTKNYGAIDGLIEEAQSMANRMEAALYDNRDWEKTREELKELNKELIKLKKEKKELKGKDSD